jgi:hypothetical protein
LIRISEGKDHGCVRISEKDNLSSLLPLDKGRTGGVKEVLSWKTNF